MIDAHHVERVTWLNAVQTEKDPLLGEGGLSRVYCRTARQAAQGNVWGFVLGMKMPGSPNSTVVWPTSSHTPVPPFISMA